MKNQQWKINEQYEIRSMSKDEFDPLFQKYTQQLFIDKTQIFRLRDTFSTDDETSLNKLSANMGHPFELRLGVFCGKDFVGWHYGRQDSHVQFYMQNSGILPEHRRQGLYDQLIQRVLEITIDMGFQSIWSRHNATNNAVIIPKLKHGFVITGMEVSDLFGTLVHLSYFSKEIRRKMMDYRVGQIKPDSEIKNLLGID